MNLTPYENTEVFGILRGTEYTYSKFFDSSSEDEIVSTGSKVLLVAGLQVIRNKMLYFNQFREKITQEQSLQVH